MEKLQAFGANNAPPRKIWIDWMKFLGMFCIIWGHLFPKLLTPFLYSFSVPLFFFISGYLTNPKEFHGSTIATHAILNKWKDSIIIPYLLLSSVCLIELSLELYLKTSFTFHVFLQNLYYILIGFSGNDLAFKGCGTLWFVYTLIITKIIALALPFRSIIILSIASLCVPIIVASNFLDISWAFLNVSLALPFFILGRYLRKYEKAINNIITNPKRILTTASIIVSAILTYTMSSINGAAWLYKCQYGQSLIIFFMCSLCGIAMILLLSIMLDNYRIKFVETISSGTILILAFQMPFCIQFSKVLSLFGSQAENIFLSFILAFFILFAFYPIILFVKRYIPILIGRR